MSHVKTRTHGGEASIYCQLLTHEALCEDTTGVHPCPSSFSKPTECTSGAIPNVMGTVDSGAVTCQSAPLLWEMLIMGEADFAMNLKLPEK